jgi:D-alanyl-D-alanine endopeptidase (penicillin-binding protein 7)
LPEIKSKAAVVIDADTGAEIFAKDADSPGHRLDHQDLRGDGGAQAPARPRRLDRDHPRRRPAAKGGSRTRLDVGQEFRNQDLLRAMLISSDNRAPTALGRAAGYRRDELIAAMNKLAKDLGLKKTKFTDSSGLRGNVSTAREMALALRAAQRDPVLAEIMATTYYVVKSRSG